MNLRPAILSAPFPWLIIITAKLFGRDKTPKHIKNRKRVSYLTFTYEGRRYVAALFLIGLAAINTGNNLLYLIVSMLLSLIVVSGFMSESTIRGLWVKRNVPERAWKNSPIRIAYTVKNLKASLPSYSVAFKESQVQDLEGTGSYSVKINKSSTVTLSSSYKFNKRGLYTLYGVDITTRFPFGLFTKGKTAELINDIIVYPKAETVNINAKVRGSSHGLEESSRKGYGGDAIGARPYGESDDSRHIDWKSSARSLTLMHKEFSSDSDREAVVVFRNYRGSNEEYFEEKVDEAASMVKTLIDKGYSVGLKTLDSEIAPQRGDAHMDSLMKELALIEAYGKKSKTEPSVHMEEN